MRLSIKRDNLEALRTNLTAGLRLSTARQVSSDDFVFSLGQGLYLFIFLLVLDFAVAFTITSQPAVLDLYAVNYYGTAYLVGIVIFLLIINWLGATSAQACQLLIASFAASPILILVSSLYRLLETYMLEMLWAYGIISALILAWNIYVIFRLFRLFLDVTILKSTVLAVINIVVTIGFLMQLPQSELWYTDADDNKDDPYTELWKLNVEDIFYSQQSLLDKSLEDLSEQRPGVIDLYMLAVGGYGQEKVFLNEVEYVKALFDRQFDTKGRSLILANNAKTTTRYPMANGHNLSYALESIASRMNTEEDVLFLFMTSHGSKNHEFSVDYGPIRLNDLTPAQIRTALDNSGIRWRVILISSCYSGGFLEALKDPTTLVITASAKDRQSFGCGSKSEFTDFGTAYFKQALGKNNNFMEAFDLAHQWVTDKEEKKSATHLFLSDMLEVKFKRNSIPCQRI